MTAFKTVRHLALALVATLGATGMATAQQEIVVPEQAFDQALHDLLPDNIKASGLLKIGTDAKYPPCQYMAEDGTTMIGFEVDMWTAMAQNLGLKLEVSNIDFPGLMPGVESGRFDVAIECIQDRPEREENFRFVTYSYGIGGAVYSLLENPKVTDDPVSLCGLTTAGQSGTSFVESLKRLSEWCVAGGHEPVAIAEYPAGSASLLAMFSGRVDFVMSDAAAVTELQKNSPKAVRQTKDPLEQPVYMGIVHHKEATQLGDALLASLQALHANGTYDLIWDKWNIAHAKLAEPGINLATARPLQQVAVN